MIEASPVVITVPSRLSVKNVPEACRDASKSRATPSGPLNELRLRSFQAWDSGLAVSPDTRPWFCLGTGFWCCCSVAGLVLLGC